MFAFFSTVLAVEAVEARRFSNFNIIDFPILRDSIIIEIAFVFQDWSWTWGHIIKYLTWNKPCIQNIYTYLYNYLSLRPRSTRWGQISKLIRNSDVII